MYFLFLTVFQSHYVSTSIPENSVIAANIITIVSCILISKLEKSMSYISINCNSTDPLVV